MATTHDISISIDYLQRLIFKMRAVQATEAVVDPDEGSNPSDDRAWDTLQDNPGDLTREEVRREIRGLNRRQQAELVALLWLGRGDAEPEDWEETVRFADESRERPTEDYLLGQPLVADLWADGLERIGRELPIDDTQTRS
jgi:hypothetical protein